MNKILDELNKKLYIDEKHQSCTREYSALNTDEERVIYTMKISRQYNMPPSIIVGDKKNKYKSTEYKNKANKLYTMPKKTSQLDLDEIIKLYTQSVAYAPPNSRELSLAYANRSAALFAAQLYDDCLIDIERALRLDYPDELKAKLYARKVRCLMILNNNTSIELIDSIDETRKWLEKMDINNAGRVIIEKTLSNSVNIECKKQRIKYDDERNLPIIPNDNPEIPGASSAIAIKYTENFGRHIIATRDIEPGEIIIVQNNYSWRLEPEKFYTNCWNCSKQIWCGIPCDYCVEVIYCNENCRNEDWNNYHDIECQIMSSLLATDLPHLALLALRLAIKAVKEAGSIQQLMNKLLSVDSCTDERTRGFVDNIFNDQKYESVYTLTRNTEKRSVADLFKRSLNSFYMVFTLATRTEFFGKKLNDNIKELEENKLVTFIGGLLMRHHQIIPSNAHTVTEEASLDGNDRGAALMPFFSLFNHSCAPMVNRRSFGKKMVMYTDCIIKKGEQIFDNYGSFYGLHTKNDRQLTIYKQYYFWCNCIACKEDWPLYLNLPSYKNKNLSKDRKNKISKALKNFEKYYYRATVGDIDDENMIKDLNNMSRCICRYVKLPCIELNNVVETLKRIHALQGNRWQSLN